MTRSCEREQVAAQRGSLAGSAAPMRRVLVPRRARPARLQPFVSTGPTLPSLARSPNLGTTVRSEE
jgi:hypothetical protein